jgi:hypothetical protein
MHTTIFEESILEKSKRTIAETRRKRTSGNKTERAVTRDKTSRPGRAFKQRTVHVAQ